MNSLPSEKRGSYSSAALKTFFNICHAWGLKNHEMQILLGLSAESTFYHWKKYPDHATLSKDTFERLSYIFGIYKALQILLPDPNIADKWVNYSNNNSLFNGKKPIERMLSGQVSDLYEVRRYLDAEREW